MLKVAITGNIAAGKSQVEAILEKEFPVYDADKIAHKILGNIDRKALGEKVFRDPKARKKLEEYIHPKVKEEILLIFDEALKNGEKFVFISIPLLFEAGFETIFDKIIFVSADEDIRLKRLMHRNNLTREQAIMRIRSQEPESLKIEKSDFVIINDNSREELEQQVLKIKNDLLKEVIA